MTATHIVRMRAAPHTDAEVLNHIPYETTLTASARSADDWVQVTYLDATGWVSGEFLTTEDACAGLPLGQ